MSKEAKSDLFCSICRQLGIAPPEREYRFHPPRRWRIDYAWPKIKLAVEIEGGVWIGGRHVRGKGYISDMEKYNKICLLGWVLLRYQPKSINYDEIRNTYVARGGKCLGNTTG